MNEPSENIEDVPLGADFPAATHAAWMELVAKVLKGSDFEKRLVTRTLDGLRIEPLYTRTDAITGTDTAQPGAAPFTRSASANREGFGWDIQQFHSGLDPKATNEAILEDLEGGATSIALHLAAPGNSGMDFSGDALAVALNTVALEICPVSLVANDRAIEAAAALEQLWTERGIAPVDRQGHFNIDPLGTLAQIGAIDDPLDTALSRAAKVAANSVTSPRLTALLADGNAYHAGGASEAQELAAMLSTLVAYLKACEAEGLPPDRALPKIALSLAADADQFMTTAKLRAARRLVWRIADACGASDAAGQTHMTAITAWRMLARRDPWTNIMRATLACSGAAIGGANSIVVLPFTYPLGKTDRFARRIARNVQIVLQEESSLGRVIDPAGGSWYVENLTNDLAQRAWEIFQDIETKGGMAAALTSGYLQDAIDEVAEKRRRDIATGRIELTGVSAFPRLGDDGITTEPWPAGQPRSSAPSVTVKQLKQARLAAPFERLRDAADAHTEKSGTRPQVFLVCLGNLADYNARANWMRNILASGGIDVIAGHEFSRSGDAGAVFADSGARVACIVSSDAVYAELAEATAHALKSAGAEHVMLAGRPGDLEAELKEAGVDTFWYAGMDRVTALTVLQSVFGIKAAA